MKTLRYSFFIIATIIMSQPVFAECSTIGSYWVFIGDSYLQRGRNSHTSIPDYMASMMEMERYENYSELGYSVAHKGERFIQQIKGWKINKKVTDVLIHGGVMNDYRAGSDFPTISTAFEKLIKKIRYKYPNARIWYVSMAYNTNAKNGPALLKIHNTRYRWYKYLAAKNGVILIKGVRRILPNIPKDCFESDGFHPRQGAREIIAEALSKKITQMLLNGI